MPDVHGGSAQPPGLDRQHCVAVVTRALQLPGGSELVTGSLGGLPGAVVNRRRSGLFGASSPLKVQLGEWRYEPAPNGRLTAAHVVGGIVIAENVLAPVEAGAHVAMVLSQQLIEYGPRILPEVLAILEGLSVAAAD